MKRLGEFRVPVLIATLGFLVWGCVATRADDLYRQRQEAARNRLAAAPAIPAVQTVVELDERAIQHGRALYNGKAVCFGCHGSNGDIRSVNSSDVARLNPSPTDLRAPTDKSVRQLYLILRYGIPSTGMVPVQEAAGLRDEDLRDLISYLLTLQGKPLSKVEIFDQAFRRDGEADRAILLTCEAEAIGDFDARALCEHRYAKRYRDLLVGRPADIPTARYREIQSSCKQRFGTVLDELARCHRLEYGVTRGSAINGGQKEQIPQKPAEP